MFISACVDTSSVSNRFSGNGTTYTVKSGDTIWGLSRKFGVSQDSIVRFNGLKSSFLTVGQKLSIPTKKIYTNLTSTKTVHVVKKGEFLSKIATMYGTTVADIKRHNGLKSNVIHPNQKLIVYGAKANSKTTQASVQTTKKYTPSQTPIVSSGEFMMPVRGKVITAFGGWKNGQKSEGINISAKLGTSVKSADGGRVVYTGDSIPVLGNAVLVEHSRGYVTVYAHLNTISVRQGGSVKKGQTLGTVGKSGGVKYPQLHFQLRKNQKPLNPNKYLY